MSEQAVNPNQSVAISAEDHAVAMSDYIRHGEEQALGLGNRGPIRFDAEGAVHPDILDAYWSIGFYVFEGVIDADELEDLRADTDNALARAPTDPDSESDANGDPALGSDLTRPSFIFAKPLSDPYGGTDKLQGRYELKLQEPTPAADAPEQSVVLIQGTLQIMDSCLRLYGHPGLLAVAAAVNGPDFIPFNEATWVKEPGLGSAVSWHQDGTTHWKSPSLHHGTHGFNFMAQLYGSTGGNGVWLIPGTHKLGKVDIKGLVSKSGTERIPGAVPLFCDPGDVIICNRQLVHGSFANTSPNRRVSVGFGFHPRNSVLNVTTIRHMDAETDTYDEARIHQRSRLIPIAIDARQQRYPDEPRFVYRPFVGQEQDNLWNESTQQNVIKNYNLLDLSI